MKAAIRLFASRGFHETSMSEVAREAGVSKALIFWHFKTKEELLMAVLNRLLDPYYIDFAEESRQLDEHEQILKLIEFYLLFIRDNASSVRFFLMRLLHDEDMPDTFTAQIQKLYESYQELLVDLIRRAQEKGYCAKDLDPDKTGKFLVSTLNGLLIDILFMRKAEFDFGGALDMLRGMLFPSLRTSTSDGKTTA